MSGGELDRLPPNQAGALYLEYSQRLMAFAMGLLRNRELAREVVQATFGKALEHAGQIPEAQRKAWLYRVARNEALAIRRRDGVAGKVHEKLRRAMSASAQSTEPGEEIIRGEQLRRVQAALDLLPPEQREVLRLRFYEEQTFAEIADATGIPLGTLLTRARLALVKLERALESDR